MILRQEFEHYAASKLQAAEYKCSIELQAYKNKQELAAQLAECCCELKEKIVCRDDRTDELIQNIEDTR